MHYYAKIICICGIFFVPLRRKRRKRRKMKLEEAITYAIMSDGHGKTTDQIAAAINRNGWHLRKDGKPVTSAQVYACICRYPSIFTKEAGRICVML